MKRRKFLLASGGVIFGSSAALSLQRPAVGVEFDLFSVPERRPSNVDAIILEFTKFKIRPMYLDENSGIDITIRVDIEGKDPITKSATNIEFTDREQMDKNKIADRTGKNSFSISTTDINVSDPNLSGSVSIRIDHPDISEKSYQRSFDINYLRTATFDITTADVAGGIPIGSFGGSGESFPEGEYQVDMIDTQLGYTVWNINSSVGDIICENQTSSTDKYWWYAPCHNNLYIKTPDKQISFNDLFTNTELSRHSSTGSGTFYHSGGTIEIVQADDSKFSDNQIETTLRLSPV